METHEASRQEGHGRARGAAVESPEKEEKEVMAERWDASASASAAGGDVVIAAHLQRRR